MRYLLVAGALGWMMFSLGKLVEAQAIHSNPRMIEQLSGQPTSPVEGEVWYNFQSHRLEYYDGSSVQTASHL